MYNQYTNDQVPITSFIAIGAKLQEAFDEIAGLKAENERLKSEVKVALKTCPNGGNDGYITPRPCQCQVEGLEAEIENMKLENERLVEEIVKANKIIGELSITVEDVRNMLQQTKI